MGLVIIVIEQGRVAAHFKEKLVKNKKAKEQKICYETQ